MNISAEKLKILELLLNTDSGILLKRVRHIFESTLAENKSAPKKGGKKKLLKNKGLNFNWEGALKEMKNEYDGVTLQHHINSLRK